MRTRTGTALAVATASAAVAVALLVSGGSSQPPAVAGAGELMPASREAPRPASRPARGAARADCSTRSEADFPGAFSSRHNLVVGPLVLVGVADTDAATVREFGGNKFPLLVKAGHTVTVQLSWRSRRSAGLAYGPLPQGEIRLRDAYRSVTFVACRPGRASWRYSPDGPSGSSASGVAVTFWSGFVLSRAPACIPLYVYVDEDPSPWRAELPLGRRCGR
jgi:hypothetical protein